MSPDEVFLEKLLEALEKARLEALVVGATAAVMQGAPVLTSDIDILVRDTPSNRRKIDALCAVDVLFDRLAGGLTFESLRSRALRIPIRKQTALVATLEDIIRSKEAAGRPKDQVHLLVLRDTLRVKKALEEKK